jgi:hypothetical protein
MQVTNKRNQSQHGADAFPHPAAPVGNMFSVHFHNMRPEHTVSSVINAMNRFIPGFTEQYDVEIQPGSANVQPKPTCFPNPESDRPQSIPEKICPASVSLHSPIPTPQQPKMQQQGPAASEHRHKPRTSTAWALFTTSTDNDLPFFRNWFLNRNCGLIPDLCTRLSKIDGHNQCFLPFDSPTHLEQALKLGIELVTSDPSISIRRWTSADIREEFNTTRSNLRVDASRSIFVRGMRTSDHPNLRTIFQEHGTIDRSISTSARTAIVEFRTTTTETALHLPLPATHPHLSIEPYKDHGSGPKPTRSPTHHPHPHESKRARQGASEPMDLSPGDEANGAPHGAAAREPSNNQSHSPRNTSPTGHQPAPPPDTPAANTAPQHTSPRHARTQDDSDSTLEQLQQQLDNASPLSLEHISDPGREQIQTTPQPPQPPQQTTAPTPPTPNTRTPAEDGTGGGDQGSGQASQRVNTTRTRTVPTSANLNPLQIEDSWTKTSDNTWVLRTKHLDRQLLSQGLKCADVLADGNCGYSAILKACGLHYPCDRLKNNTDLFLTANEQHVRAAFNETQPSNMDAFISELHRKLRTPGVYTNHHLLQLVAWNQRINIGIHDVLDDHVITIQGQRPWLPQMNILPTVHIAYRRHQQHWSYNADYTPRAKLDGHYWAITTSTMQPSHPLSVSNRFAVLGSDDVDMPDAEPPQNRGNARRSAPLRH